MKKISIITPTFNEEDNVKLMVDAIANVAKKETNYSFEHIFIDNASTETLIISYVGSSILALSYIFKKHSCTVPSILLIYLFSYSSCRQLEI